MQPIGTMMGLALVFLAVLLAFQPHGACAQLPPAGMDVAPTLACVALLSHADAQTNLGRRVRFQ